MKAIASLVLVIAVGCVHTNRTHTESELYAMRERASSKRTLSIVGISLGIATAIVGGVLAAHGVDVRSRESSADDESGIAPLLGGMLLASGGGVLAIGAGISFAISSHEHDDIDAQLRARHAQHDLAPAMP